MLVGRWSTMEVSSLIDALREQGGLTTAAAQATPLDTPVPTCPGWTVSDLLRHTGGVHRWAATIVGEARPEPISLDQPHEIDPDLPGEEGLVDWYAAGHAALVAALSTAPADLDCWAFMRTAPSPAAFWARRQAHEATIHRIDAESAAGHRSTIGADLAADGIDELLTGFLPRNRKLRAEADTTLLVLATDVDRKWLVRIGSERPQAAPARPGEVADATVSGPAETVYLALWNRSPLTEVTTTGDTGLLDLWVDKVQVRWS
jgi:uncharacterized protein (TIGR03083 family)